ncbi:hypothetical protein N6L24_14535 [Cognatishimia sp. SS12]|uniref:hypothetical protein n=1 Tax=Cognatishimia sp. SS12 TaxID=2979465 RepID=UPI00232BA459|nr:hypothetical protein [Cognatishimia sp. SS12]MDC0739503.1 hypothetical protein [Cognatishimia sp. SS12]
MLRCLAILSLLSFLGAAPDLAAQTAENAKALYERAEVLRKSARSNADLREALKLQQDLLAQGSNRSQLRIAQLHFALGEKDLARTAFEAAAESGSASARMSLAKYHATGGFGASSDPEKGIAMLTALAEGPNPARAQMTLADLYMEGVGGTPNEAIALYQAAATAGEARASAKLGSAYLRGNGTTQDMTAAADALNTAVSGGYEAALLHLAEAQIALGRGADAAQSLQKAVDLGLKGAEAKQALAHYEGKLGASSDRTLGERGLLQMATAGNTSAANIVLRNHERRSTRMGGADVPAIVAALEDRMAQGDARATHILARAYRELRRFIPGASAKHAALVADHLQNLPEKDRYAEIVTARYDLANHGKSRRALTEELEAVSGPAFVSAAMRMRGIERTSYVYLMQSELKALGAYPGSVSGKLTQRTIDAMFDFCRAEGIFETCKHGPVTYDSALLMAQAVAERKKERLAGAAEN